MSNPVNRVGTETAARDLSSKHPLSDGGPVTANNHLQPSSASTGPNGTVPPSAVLSGVEQLPEEPHLLEDEFHLRRSTRNIARNNHYTSTPDDGPSDTQPLPYGNIGPVAQYRDGADLLQGTPFLGGANELANLSSQHTVANAPNPGKNNLPTAFRSVNLTLHPLGSP